MWSYVRQSIPTVLIAVCVDVGVFPSLPESSQTNGLSFLQPGLQLIQAELHQINIIAVKLRLISYTGGLSQAYSMSCSLTGIQYMSCSLTNINWFCPVKILIVKEKKIENQMYHLC